MPMIVTDPTLPDNHIVFANEAFQHMTGYSRDECIDQNCRFLQGSDTNRADVERLRYAINAGQGVSVDLLNYKKDGTPFWNALYISPVVGEAGDIQFFFASQLDVSERVTAHKAIADQKERVDHEVRARTADLEASLEAQSLLLHEVDHRVKNNLSVIGSLLRMQIRETEDPGVRSALRSTMERVDAMASIHRRLYQAEDVRFFELSSFILDLVQEAIGTSAYKSAKLESTVMATSVPSAHATSIGLLVNEILLHLLNAYTPIESIQLSCLSDAEMVSIFIANKVSAKTPQSSVPAISLKLVARLAAQLTAKVSWDHSLEGLAVTIKFPAGIDR